MNKSRIRGPSVANMFYPADARALRRALGECLSHRSLGPGGFLDPSDNLVGGMVPHAGYVYSGPCAAHLYARLRKDIESVVLLGVDHRGQRSKAEVSSADYWATPLGQIPVDAALCRRLTDLVDFLKWDDWPYVDEHSIEVQLPFLQEVLESFTLVPISLSHLSEEECRRLGMALAQVWEETHSQRRLLILASSDLSHYLPPAETERFDRMALEPVISLDAQALLRTVAKEQISMCGVFPTAVLLFAARAIGATEARLLKHYHSGEVEPMTGVVGYASVSIETSPMNRA